MKDDSKNLHAGHRQRVRDKYMSSGLGAFNDVELLELLLFCGYRRANTNETAHVLFNSFNKSIPELFEACPALISEKGGVNSNSAALISSLKHLSAGYSKSKHSEKVWLGSFEAVGAYAISMFAGARDESFCLLCLDKNYRLLNAVKMPRRSGQPEHSYLTSDIIENVIKFNSSYAIMTNNRLEDTLQIFDENIKTAVEVSKALKTIEAVLVDHVIVSGGRYTSLCRERIVF